ncbi:MAG: archaetidylserine decarboxylase [Burkholderiales bacterium]|nr:archaetidylserine decarboxylase [Burkholderiales bacterium]
MKLHALRRLVMHEDVNFLLTNRVPRILLTRWMGRLSKIEHPWFAAACIRTWKLFTDLDLSEAEPRRYRSLHACFTRALKPGARTFHHDAHTLASPSDGIVGACGAIDDELMLQAKGMPYTLNALMGPTQDSAAFCGGMYVTLRLTSAMYHRFHAPHDCRVDHVTHIDGDTWNVNPIALARVERLFCRNERAVVRLRLAHSGLPVALVPVAAILVAGIRLHWLDLVLHARRDGPTEFAQQASFRGGEEMGWFEHGSTIIVLAPRGVSLAPGILPGARIKAGAPLLQLPDPG